MHATLYQHMHEYTRVGNVPRRLTTERFDFALSQRLVVVVAFGCGFFPRLQRFWGECSTIHSLYWLFFFFKV